VGHHLAEQQQPEDRLHGTADEVHRVVTQLGDLGVGDGPDLGQVSGDRPDQGRVHRRCAKTVGDH
jgi:hypothetical protein